MPRFREAVLQGVGRGNRIPWGLIQITHTCSPDFPLLLPQAPWAWEGLGVGGKEGVLPGKQKASPGDPSV